MAVETMPVYREARDADLPTCAELWLAMFEEVGKHHEADFRADWRERFVTYISRRMKENGLRYFIAELDGEIAGTAGALIREGYPTEIHGLSDGYVFGVSVKPPARNRGIATRLTTLAVDWLKEQGVARLQLHASPFGRPIYEKMGFVPTNEMQLRL
jgi:GNAT superfamily N-acetyltransferase